MGKSRNKGKKASKHRKRKGGNGDLANLVFNTLLTGMTVSQPRRYRIFNKDKTRRKKSYKRPSYYTRY